MAKVFCTLSSELLHVLLDFLQKVVVLKACFGMKTVFCCYTKDWTTNDFNGLVQKQNFTFFLLISLYGCVMGSRGIIDRIRYNTIPPPTSNDGDNMQFINLIIISYAKIYHFCNYYTLLCRDKATVPSNGSSNTISDSKIYAL